MQLLSVQYPDKSSRYFIDGKRVSHDHYETVKIMARMDNKQHCCFITKEKSAGKFFHYLSIN